MTIQHDAVIVCKTIRRDKTSRPETNRLFFAGFAPLRDTCFFSALGNLSEIAHSNRLYWIVNERALLVPAAVVTVVSRERRPAVELTRKVAVILVELTTTTLLTLTVPL